MIQSALHNRLLDFLTTMNDAESADNAWASTVASMRGLGASHVSNYLDLKESDLVYSHSSPSWVGEMFLEQVYPDHDPRLAHCRANVTPYFSGKGLWSRARELPARRRHFEEEVISVGIRSVVSVPVHMLAGRDWGYVGVATDLCADEFDKLYKDHGTLIQLGAIAAFNRIHALTREMQAERTGISERERECLLWLSRGLRYDQIADRLGLRRVTVELHMAKARRKLDARTREQALVKALQLNIIDP